MAEQSIPNLGLVRLTLKWPSYNLDQPKRQEDNTCSGNQTFKLKTLKMPLAGKKGETFVKEFINARKRAKKRLRLKGHDFNESSSNILAKLKTKNNVDITKKKK